MPYLVVPSLALDLLVRALASCADLGRATPGKSASLAARLLPIEEAQVTVVRLEGEVDLESLARALSVGGTPVALVDTETERWRTWKEGTLAVDFGPSDALYVPLDGSGDPDLDAEPRTRSQLGDVPVWRMRTPLDLGMQSIASCRFGPVAHAMAAPTDERHFQLISHGHRSASELPR